MKKLFTLISIISILLFATNAFAGGNGKNKSGKTSKHASPFNENQTCVSRVEERSQKNQRKSRTQPFADGLLLEKNKKPKQGIIGVLIGL